MASSATPSAGAASGSWTRPWQRVGALAREFRHRWADSAYRWRVVTLLVAMLILGVAFGVIVGPMLANWKTFGFHDWDVEAAYRYITVVSLKQYHELPWWHPWLCGGVPAWGHVEAATNLVSPYLPFYLLGSMQTAIRVEVIGGAIIAMAGCWMLTGRFTESIALKALVAAIYVLNGRWALQVAAGHTWHLQFGLLPWVFFFFDRSIEPRRLVNAVYAAITMALMIYWGGIYPLPQTALLLTLYAPLVALLYRSWRPLASLAVIGVASIGLAAPKLLAITDFMDRIPRLIESREVIGLSETLVMMLDTDQQFGSRPVHIPAYNWHEWGIYIGFGGVSILVIALLFARGPRENALRILGLLCLVLGFGAFHEYAPWALIHRLPVFASQHVPSRYHYPMLLLLGLGFASLVGRFIDPRRITRPWLDLVLLVVVAAFAADLAHVSRLPFGQAWWMIKPAEIPRTALFEHRRRAPTHYVRRDWAEPMLLTMMANVGVIECYGVDPNFVPGAVAADAPAYRGRAFVADGPGSAEVVEWSPNHAVVRVTGARPGALVEYNMNYDPSWRADGQRAIERDRRVAARLLPGHDTIVFRYFPRSLFWSLPIFLATITALAGIPRLWRRRRRALDIERAQEA